MTPEEPVEILGSHMPTITRLLLERQHLAGAVAELGVYAGGTTFQLERFGRTVFAMDTFSGVPVQDYTDGIDIDDPGKFRAPAGLLARMAATGWIIPVKGRFEVTLPTIYTPMVGAYLDCDLYESARQALGWLARVLVPGGFIVLDDFLTHRGIQLAVGEFLERWPDRTSFDGAEVILWK